MSAEALAVYLAADNSISPVDTLGWFMLGGAPQPASSLPTRLPPHLIVSHLNVDYRVNGMCLKTARVEISNVESVQWYNRKVFPIGGQAPQLGHKLAQSQYTWGELEHLAAPIVTWGRWSGLLLAIWEGQWFSPLPLWPTNGNILGHDTEPQTVSSECRWLEILVEPVDFSW